MKIITLPNWKLRYLSDEVYGTDGFITVHDVLFKSDNKFMDAYNESINGLESVMLKPNSRFYKEYWENSEELTWRCHITCWAAKQVENIEGDFMECGVANGILSKTICEYTDFGKLKRNFYLVDRWASINGNNNSYHYPSTFNGNWFEFAKSRFEKYPNVNLIHGTVPDILEKLLHIEKIAYLSIDMNDGDAELATVEFFWDRISVGGIIYFDDFLFGYKKLQKNILEFAARKKVHLLHIPTGNSIIVKPPNS